MGMSEFANHVIALANEKIGGITNLQLHKVMYFALGNYIKVNGIDDFVKEIYNERFEAWPYGPVVRSVYFENRSHGRFNITSNAQLREEFEPINRYIEQNLTKNVNDLVTLSHEHSTWIDNREDILLHNKIYYELEDIENDFS